MLYTYTLVAPVADLLEDDRPWNAASEKSVLSLRAKAGVAAAPPLLRNVVLDFANVAMTDTTGVQAIIDPKAALKRVAGDELDLKFLTWNERVQLTFERSV